jgi:hypothetical protein
MINVRVGLAETPVVRKRRKVGFHFFVDVLLKVDTEFTVGPDDQICADANIAGNVTVGVGDGAVASIIRDGVLCAFHRSMDEARAETFGFAVSVGNRGRSENEQ